MATKRPFHCRQVISEEIALETSGVRWDLGSTCIQESIKILDEDTLALSNLPCLRRIILGSEKLHAHLLPDCLDTIWHLVAEMQWKTMFYRILQCRQRNAVRISMAGHHVNRVYSAIGSRSDDTTSDSPGLHARVRISSQRAE